MRKVRQVAVAVLLFACIVKNIHSLTFEQSEAMPEILATQEVEEVGFDEREALEAKIEVKSPAKVGASVYYSTAKGWEFNDIVYIESCPKYESAYGGVSTGTLKAGYYRFVKTNGAYVALCEVNLTGDTVARKAYKELWEKYDGIWSWKQALHNQLDGTKEGDEPLAKKSVVLENGVRVSDFAQNYRFIKCWIKIEDFTQNPDTIQEYTQTIQYRFVNGRTHVVKENVSMRKTVKVREGLSYTVIPEVVAGYRFAYMKVNGFRVDGGAYSYEVSSDNEICIYYKPYEMTIFFHGQGGQGSMDSQVIYYGETMNLTSNKYRLSGGKFMGWSLTEGSQQVKYKNEEAINGNEILKNCELHLYAVWDFAPNIQFQNIYLSRNQLISNENMEEYVLSYCIVEDKEDGNIEYGDGNSMRLDVNLERILETMLEGWINLRIIVKDSAGNQVMAGGALYVFDDTVVRLSPRRENIRFISADYIHTMDAASVWQEGVNYRYLLRCFSSEVKESWKKTEFGWQRIK